jgi:hypothetical protein
MQPCRYIQPDGISGAQIRQKMSKIWKIVDFREKTGLFLGGSGSRHFNARARS